MSLPAATTPPASDPPTAVTPLPTSSSSPLPASSRLPRPSRWSKGARLLVALAVAVLVILLLTGGWWMFAGLHAPRTDLITHTVQRDKLQQTIVERGTLESAENRDVICRVKAGTKNSTIA